MEKQILLGITAALLAAPGWGGDYTALDRYVSAPDSSFRYSEVRTVSLAGLTAYQLDMVSQTWLTPAEVDKPEWHHWVTIFKPDQVTTSTALLFINGGSNSATPPQPDLTLQLAALNTGAVVVDLGQVPNQPLKFAGESRTRSEDAIIAYTWERYLKTGIENWPARLPMTKAAVRAMDAATAFLSKLPGGGVAVKNFIVAGGSKRGWTTWSVAEVDPRVIAVAPIVIDTLNVAEVFQHQYQAYGFWAPAVQDYVDMGIMSWFGTPQMEALLDIEDPYRYTGRLALPSYSMCSTGDQFFPPDSPRFYFDGLPGEKYLRFVPNTDHGMNSLETLANLVQWVRAVTQNYPRPRFYWRADRGSGTLTVRVVDTPTQVNLWQTTNPKARDFRLETIGAAWKKTELKGDRGTYTATIKAPDKGFTAFLVELAFPGPGDAPLVFTTEVMVSPDYYPFGPPPGFSEPGLTRREHPPRPRTP
jgi:PhoPQ-activated pathogenicity-related protein